MGNALCQVQVGVVVKPKPAYRLANGAVLARLVDGGRLELVPERKGRDQKVFVDGNHVYTRDGRCLKLTHRIVPVPRLS